MTDYSKYIDSIQEKHLPENFRIVSELCGIEVARLLMKKLSGMFINPPLAHRLNDALREYIRKRMQEESHPYLVHKLVQETGATQRKIEKIIREFENESET